MQKLLVPLLAFIATLYTSDVFADGNPLFESDEKLELTLEVPMRELLRRAKKKPVLNGQLKYVAADGNNVEIDLTITTRGKSRLEICSFPPLSISLDKKQSESTVFAGQRTLKIVTHCRNSKSYRRYLQQEYGIYKAYRLLSDKSFRVRMLNVTYRDSEQERKDEVEAAFFIESDREVAERLGMARIKTKAISPSQFDVVETNKYELFQYLIANTDWSVKRARGTDSCCHNGKVIADPETDTNWVVLPYDFDQAGLINTEYALPAEDLRLRSVRTRLYRGRCAHNEQLKDTIALFNEKRSGIEAALAPQALSAKEQKRALKYIDNFFEIINDAEKLDRQVIGKCRGAPKS